MLIAFCPLEMMRCELRAIDRGDFGSVRPGEGVILDWWSHPVIPVASPNSQRANGAPNRAGDWPRLVGPTFKRELDG
jgi:hypothetical protein